MQGFEKKLEPGMDEEEEEDDDEEISENLDASEDEQSLDEEFTSSTVSAARSERIDWRQIAARTGLLDISHNDSID
jgi:hypothetical protein